MRSGCGWESLRAAEAEVEHDHLGRSESAGDRFGGEKAVALAELDDFNGHSGSA